MYSSILFAECPLDHFIIGCNRDGIAGTNDDRQLFIDCEHKYRNTGKTEHANWFYPLNLSVFPEYPYRIGEPGFDAFQTDNPAEEHTYDPNRALAGVPNQDYTIIVKYLAISPGLRAKHKDYPQFTIDQPCQCFNHSLLYSLLGEPHVHISYEASDGSNLLWMTFYIYDESADADQYLPSEPVTIVFNREPLSGDLVIDGNVNIDDLTELAHYWLKDDASIENDFYERADSNRDGRVDLFDFALLADNWLASLNDTDKFDSSQWAIDAGW